MIWRVMNVNARPSGNLWNHDGATGTKVGHRVSAVRTSCCAGAAVACARANAEINLFRHLLWTSPAARKSRLRGSSQSDGFSDAGQLQICRDGNGW